MELLGQVLLASGLVTASQLAQALEEQRRTGRSLGRVLVGLGTLAEGELVAALGRQIGLPFVDLAEQTLDGAAVATVPEPVCRRHAVVPVGFDGARLVLAMADPANAFALDDVRSITSLEVRCVVATKADVHAALDRCHRPGRDDLSGLAGDLDAPAEDDPPCLRARSSRTRPSSSS